MKIVSISWVRNEADIIESFVRHSCMFLDRMIIVDHRSCDNTPEILERLRQKGLPLDLRREDSFSYTQGESLTALLAELRSDPPDLVLPLDADEFLRTRESGTLKTILEQLPKDIPSLVPWQTYIPMPEDDLLECNVPLRIRHRKTCEAPQWYKVIIPKTLLKQNIRLPMGCHTVIDADTGKEIEHSVASNLFLAHFPVRSADQIAGKVFAGWLSHMANPQKTPGSIFQWKAIFDELKSGKQIDANSLMRLALEYGTEKQWQALPPEEKNGSSLVGLATSDQRTSVSENIVPDPIPVNFQLKHEAKRLPPLQILLESAETLAQEVTRITR